MLKLLSSTFAAEWASAALVFVVAALAGRAAAEGMNMIQLAGALTAVLGSITVAVAVRIWPGDARVSANSED